MTLEALVLGASAELAAGRSVTCPVCAEARLEASGCPSCGSELS